MTPRVDPGQAQPHAGVVEQEAGLEVVRAVHGQVGAGQQVQDVVGGDVGHDALDGDLRVDAAQLAPRGLGLGQAVGDVLLVEEPLALQVVQLDEVAVDDAQMADAAPRQVVGDHRAGRAAADQHDGRVQQPALAGLAQVGEDDLAGVAGEVGGGHKLGKKRSQARPDQRWTVASCVQVRRGVQCPRVSFCSGVIVSAVPKSALLFTCSRRIRESASYMP